MMDSDGSEVFALRSSFCYEFGREAFYLVDLFASGCLPFMFDLLSYCVLSHY